METTLVGIRDAKIHLSRLIKKVRAGNEVILTDRGQQVVRMVPVQSKALGLSQRVKGLEQRGILEPRSGNAGQRVPAPLPLEAGLARRYLEEDRNR